MKKNGDEADMHEIAGGLLDEDQASWKPITEPSKPDITDVEENGVEITNENSL